MKKIFYEKRGRRYYPVSEYDSELMDGFTKGAHLVMSYPGGKSTRYNINPNYAALIAASRVAENAISEAVRKASELRPHNTPITEEQKKAWEALAKSFDSDRYYIELPSAREIAEAGAKALQLEADRLLKNPAVKKAYEHFMLVCELTKDNNESNS
jgi:hypothetical protein